jgi:hypothetical protein
MSVFQCIECGCAENTAFGWFHPRFNKRLTKPENIGKALCSACAPETFLSGEPTKFNGQWHAKFDRTFLPHGEFIQDGNGNIEHELTGLVGNEAYVIFGKTEPYPKNNQKD